MRHDRGFALPMTVFLVALLSLMLAFGFARVRADRQVGIGSQYATEALAIAQSGLQKYLGTQAARPPDGDSVTIIGIPGGYAEVVVRVAQRPADTLAPQTYIVRATGYVVKPTISSEPLAQRSVAQFAAWHVGHMEAPAALTARNPVRRTDFGDQNLFSVQDSISGVDACGVEPPTRSVWTPLYTYPWHDAFHPVTFEPAAPDESAVATTIDWVATIGNGIIPDHASIQLNDNGWTVQRVQGNATLNSGFGTGLLIVTGELTFSGSSASWKGVILVGQDLDFEALQNKVEGLVVTGLQGGVADNTEFGRASITTVVRYNSCYVRQALAALTGFAPISNTWIDNWATY